MQYTIPNQPMAGIPVTPDNYNTIVKTTHFAWPAFAALTAGLMILGKKKLKNPAVVASLVATGVTAFISARSDFVFERK